MTLPDHDAASDLPDEADYPVRSADLPWDLIVTLLAPMFMGADVRDPSLGRLAAMETIASYGARTQVELMQIAQIIGFSLAAMDNLALAMADDVPLAMKLRLRGGATALNRAAQQNCRMLEKIRRLNPTLEPSIGERGGMSEAEARPGALVGEERGFAADENAGTATEGDPVKDLFVRAREAGNGVENAGQPPDARPVPIEAATAPAARGGTGALTPPPRQFGSVDSPALSGEQQRKRMWARAMEAVAGTLSADPGNLPSSVGRSEQIWARMADLPASEVPPSVGGVRLPIPGVGRRAQELSKPP
jgi:hypothetical protein